MSGEIFFLPDAGGERAQWLRLATDGAVAASGHGPLEELKGVATGQRLVVILPGEEVLLCRAAVPGQRRRLLAQAVPYALEDQLAADVETLHFAFGRIADGEVAVAVTDRAFMDGWLARLREAGLNPYALVPDTLLLPWREGEWQMVCTAGRCLLRSGEAAAIAMEAANAPLMTGQLLQEAEPAPQKLVIHSEGEMALELPGVEIERQPLSGPLLHWLSRHYDERTAINLLQGPYSRRERLGQYWRPWRAAAALLAALLLLQTGSTIVEYRHLSSERLALQNEIEQIYRQAFPEARKVVNPKVQMERALKELRGGGAAGGLNTLLAEAGREFQETPGVELQRLNFREGQLDVALTISDLQRLDELKQRLNQGGKLHVEIQSASAQGSQVEARLKIKGASS